MNYGNPGPEGFPLLASITDDSGSPLLSILRAGDCSGSIVAINDRYGRSVYYHTSTYDNANVPDGYPQTTTGLDHVSLLVPTGTANPGDRYLYGYEYAGNGGSGPGAEGIPSLATITVPSPTGYGQNTATISYDPDTGVVSSIADAYGNTHTYESVNEAGSADYPSNYTKVTVANSGGDTVYSYTANFDSNMSETGRTNGAGTTVSSSVFSDPDDPYRPSSTTDGNGNVTDYTWDAYGNLQTETTPRSTVLTNTWSYTNFALGELTELQFGGKTATTLSYDEPSELISSESVPTPGTSGGGTVTYSYTYDSLGNMLTKTSPGNGTTSSITTTYNYTNDEGYSQSDSVDEPLTVTDNLSHVTHMRYDSLGDATSITDALANETDTSYNVAQQPLTTTFPATGDTGSGHATSTIAYMYAGGSSMSTTLYDESGSQVRQTINQYGAEGAYSTQKRAPIPLESVH